MLYIYNDVGVKAFTLSVKRGNIKEFTKLVDSISRHLKHIIKAEQEAATQKIQKIPFPV